MVVVISQKEAEWLFDLARSALYSNFTKTLPSERKRFFLSKTIKETHGIFVTLWNGAIMRGCIGTPFPFECLEDAVQTMAVRSALYDSRFTPVTIEELPHIRIEISILTPLTPIQPHQIELGVHGLFINHPNSSGLLFPQVPIEEGWDVKMFLEQLCLKADLPPHAWKEGADLLAFKMQVVSEPNLPAVNELFPV